MTVRSQEIKKNTKEKSELDITKGNLSFNRLGQEETPVKEVLLTNIKMKEGRIRDQTGKGPIQNQEPSTLETMVSSNFFMNTLYN